MPCTLIRLAGCPLRCRYCDTPKAIPTDSGQLIPIDTIMQQVRAAQRPLILLTGGEPLAQRHAVTLLEQLLQCNAIVQVETSGAYSVTHLPAGVRRIIDLKTPGSGEADKNHMENLNNLRSGDEIKLVLGDAADYQWAKSIIDRYQLGRSDVPVLLSPVWGELAASELCSWALRDNLPVRIQMQLHKTIWGAEAEGV